MTEELWYPQGNVEVRRARPARGTVYVPPTNPVPPTPTSKWPGDPGDGKFNIGWALGPGFSTIPAARTNAGYPGDAKVSVIHDYSGNSLGVDQGRVNAAIAAGFIPSQSFKMPAYSPAQIITGAADGALSVTAKFCLSKAPWPIWLCYYHEPEDNFTSEDTQRVFRAASRHIVSRFRMEGVDNVTWMPIYMNPWTMSTSSGRDWRTWHPDWTGSGWHDDITMTVFGADTYNPLVGGTTNRSFASMWDMLRETVERPGYPVWDYVQPEFGVSYNVDPDPDWVQWFIDARSYATQNRIKNFTYWDNSTEQTGRYSFGPTYDPSGNKLAGWRIVTNASVRKVTA